MGAKNKIAMSATFKLIKRKEVHGAPGEKFGGWTVGRTMWKKRR